MPLFTNEEKALLAPFVTSTDDDVFVVKGPAMLVGAIFARYSRASGGFRETLLKEFLKDGLIDAKKANDLIERVLIAYGDDSVGELEGVHVAFENISILATKEIEDRRIGGSPIEQSTRYVFYDMRDAHGNFRYHRPSEVMGSPHESLYIETMDFLFQTYSDLVEPMKQYFSGLKPMETAEYDIRGDGEKITLTQCSNEKERKAFRITWNADVRTKACDALRALLPIATTTNVGVFGNGRFFQNVLSHCYGHNLAEVQHIAKRAHNAISEVMPRYVARAKPSLYLAEIQKNMQQLTDLLFGTVRPDASQPVTLIDRTSTDTALFIHGIDTVNEEGIQKAMQQADDIFTITCMLYPHLSIPFEQIRQRVRSFNEETRRNIITTYIGKRVTRRDRPGRALESGYPYTFDMETDFGTYKDLERHRMGTQLRQPFSPILGFSVPEDMKAAGFEKEALECSKKAKTLYNALVGDLPNVASYATLHGSHVRWLIGMNDRALMHMLELRTTPQGHPQYRRVCQKMHKAIQDRSPWRAHAMRFVDHGDYFWSRADSEAKQRVKEAKLRKKKGE